MGGEGDVADDGGVAIVAAAVMSSMCVAASSLLWVAVGLRSRVVVVR